MKRFDFQTQLFFLAALHFFVLSFDVLGKPMESAGHVIIAGPGVKATAKDGQVRLLQRRSKVYEGDTIITGKSILQVRFADGSLTSLKPGTKFHIESFNWQGKEDGSERGIFSLIKGGLNTISGLIGKKRKKNYLMKTPVATIGIRGTHYALRYCLNNCPREPGRKMQLKGLFGNVISGRISVSNRGGDILFGPDSFFHVGGNSIVPQRLVNPPSFMLKARPVKPRQQSGAQQQRIKPAIDAGKWESKVQQTRIKDIGTGFNRMPGTTLEPSRLGVEGAGGGGTLEFSPQTIQTREFNPSVIKRDAVPTLPPPTLIRK